MRDYLHNYLGKRGLMSSGDVVLFSGKGAFSNVIKRRTSSKYSHVGLVLRFAEDDLVMVAESTKECSLPDEFTGKVVKGLQYHQLSKRLEIYNGSMWWCPLLNPLDLLQKRKMMAWVRERKNKVTPYDTVQAIGAGIDWWDSLGLENDPDFDKLFCSEFVAKALQEAGKVPALLNPSEQTPEDVSKFNCLGVPVVLKEVSA